MSPLPHVSYAAVLDAMDRIKRHVHRTPIVTNRTINEETGASLFFKCENLQKVGAFKARGAVNAVLALDDDVAAAGVVTHSSGNHGQAMAYAASIRGIPCAVVMPENASPIKRRAIEGYGGDVVLAGQYEREDAAEAVRAERGATLIPPFDHVDVIAGQGTTALELIEDVGEVDMIVAPVGGGGLLSGIAVATTGSGSAAQVIGAEPLAVDDAYRSLTSGVRQPRVVDPVTTADGLLTGLGELTFDILLAAGAQVVTVTEDAIVDAARFHLERMKLVVEPSGATALAAVRAMGASAAGRRIGVVISGGNTDLAWFERSA
jgi:threonine dehydratase